MNALERAPSFLHWSGSLGVVLAVHAAVVCTVLWWHSRNPPPQLPASAQAVMVELAPQPTAPPAPPTNLPPGPPQQEQRKSQPKAQSTPVSEPEHTPQPHPDVALPSQAQQDRPEKAAQTHSNVDQTTAPPSIQAPDGSRYAAEQSLSGADHQRLVTWQAQLLGHLEQYKRYPRTAQRRRQEGTVQVQFLVDRQGHVSHLDIARGSGFEALDTETIATVQRADPLPPPPAEIKADPVQVLVPMDFSLRR